MPSFKDSPVDARVGTAFLVVYRPAFTPAARVSRNTLNGIRIGWFFRVGPWVVSFGRHLL